MLVRPTSRTQRWLWILADKSEQLIFFGRLHLLIPVDESEQSISLGLQRLHNQTSPFLQPCSSQYEHVHTQRDKLTWPHVTRPTFSNSTLLTYQPTRNNTTSRPLPPWLLCPSLYLCAITAFDGTNLHFSAPHAFAYRSDPTLYSPASRLNSRPTSAASFAYRTGWWTVNGIYIHGERSDALITWMQDRCEASRSSSHGVVAVHYNLESRSQLNTSFFHLSVYPESKSTLSPNGRKERKTNPDIPTISLATSSVSSFLNIPTSFHSTLDHQLYFPLSKLISIAQHGLAIQFTHKNQTMNLDASFKSHSNYPSQPQRDRIIAKHTTDSAPKPETQGRTCIIPAAPCSFLSIAVKTRPARDVPACIAWTWATVTCMAMFRFCITVLLGLEGRGIKGQKGQRSVYAAVHTGRQVCIHHSQGNQAPTALIVPLTNNERHDISGFHDARCTILYTPSSFA